MADASHPLQDPWTFWLDRKVGPIRTDSDPVTYVDNLKKLSEMHTVEEFTNAYRHMIRAYSLPHDINLSFFRNGTKPMWEEFPDGGCWIVRIRRKKTNAEHDTNVTWEKFLLGCVGEQFGTPEVIGVVCATKAREVVFSVWVSKPEARNHVGESLKRLLNLDDNALLQYKENRASMKDYTTYRNAEVYTLRNGVACSQREARSPEHRKVPELDTTPDNVTAPESGTALMA
eukprot:GEMP01071827.1.p1 GENE.GEMP01071827.1~~GEMP01071827.1.p1  ORF type:complete len:230 (-),score=67.28 GEMP01071827.1:425-1114(-)